MTIHRALSMSQGASASMIYVWPGIYDNASDTNLTLAPGTQLIAQKWVVQGAHSAICPLDPDESPSHRRAVLSKCSAQTPALRILPGGDSAAPPTLVQGFTLTSCGIQVQPRATVTLRDCNVDCFERCIPWAIDASQPGVLRVEHCDLHYSGIRVADDAAPPDISAPAPLHPPAPRIVISHTNVTRCAKTGIALINVTGAQLEHVLVSFCNDGLVLDGGSGIRINSSAFRAQYLQALMMQGARNVVVEHTLFHSHFGGLVYGLNTLGITLRNCTLEVARGITPVRFVFSEHLRLESTLLRAVSVHQYSTTPNGALVLDRCRHVDLLDTANEGGSMEPSFGSCLHIVHSKHVRVLGFRSTGFQSLRPTSRGIIALEHSHNVTLTHVDLQHNDLRTCAIYIMQCHDVVLRHLTMGHNQRAAVNILDSHVAMARCNFTHRAVIAVRAHLHITHALFAHGAATSPHAAVRTATPLTWGGALNMDGSHLHLEHCRFVHHSAQRGGALGLNNTHARLEDCIFEKNRAVVSGGAIFLGRAGRLDIVHCQFRANWVGSSPLPNDAGPSALASTGGAIAISVLVDDGESPLAVSDSSFDYNIAHMEGGAIFVHMLFHPHHASGDFVIPVARSNFTSNVALAGGALYMTLSPNNLIVDDQAAFNVTFRPTCTLALRQGRFILNIAMEGGAMGLFAVDSDIAGSHFLANRATSYRGGAISTSTSGSVQIVHSRFVRNVAAHEAGVLFATGSRLVRVHASWFEGNLANVVAGLMSLRSFDRFELTDSTLLENSATYPSASIVHCSSLETILVNNTLVVGQDKPVFRLSLGDGAIFHNCTFIRNRAMAVKSSGACIFLHSFQNSYIRNCLFKNNFAQEGAAVFTENSPLEIRHTHFVECNASIRGGALCLLSPFTITHCYFTTGDSLIGGALFQGPNINGSISDTVFFYPRASVAGGAIASLVADTLIIRRTVFRECHSNGPGGAMYLMKHASLIVEDCRFETCVSADSGGAISAPTVAFLDIIRSNFTDNTASFLAGAIQVVLTSKFTLKDSRFTRNRAQLGGALYTHRSHLWATRAHFHENTAYDGGACMAREMASFTAHGIEMVRNRAVQSGGGIYSLDAETAPRVTNSSFLHNTARIGGGAVYVRGTVCLVLYQSRFESNAASQGGAVAIHSDPQDDRCCVTECLFASNNATSKGGAVYGQNIHLHCTNNTYTSNTADAGGAIALHLSSTDSTGGRFISNAALTSGHGGAIHLEGNPPENPSPGRGRGSDLDTDLIYRFHGARILHNTALRGGGIVARDCRVWVERTRIESNWVSHEDLFSPSTKAVLTLGGGIYASESAAVRLTQGTRVWNNTGGGVAVVLSSLAVTLGTQIVDNPALPRVRNMTKEISIYCDEGRVDIDASCNVTWHLCSKCRGTGKCHMPPPRISRITPAVGTEAELRTVTVYGSNMLNYKPKCRLENRLPLLNGGCHAQDSEHEHEHGHGHGHGHGHLAISLPAKVISHTHVECYLNHFMHNREGKWYLRVSNDRNVWSTEVHRVELISSLYWIPIVIIALVSFVAAIAVFLALFALYRFLRLRRASRIELKTFEKITSVDLEKLKIIKRIGVGTCGEVFKATLHGTPVAVKRLFPLKHDDVARKEKFDNEVAVLKTLRHPNIVLFIGATNSEPHIIVTEFMSRGTLDEILQSSQSLSLEERQFMALDAARGMSYLHNLSPPIIHRDLKSPNLLVDSNFTVKVADFGLSRLTDDNLTMTSCGTPAWTAPEVLAGDHYSLKADVYSYGVVLWELVTREEPFGEATNPMHVVLGVVRGLRPALPANTPEPFKTLIEECWRANPEERPNFRQIVRRLEKGLPHRPEPELPPLPEPTGFSSGAYQMMTQPLLGSINEGRGTGPVASSL